MAAFNFPASPSNGDTYTLNNVDYTYNGTVWKKTSSGLTDGDKGDITVSNSGQTFTIDNDVITDAKLANSINSAIAANTAKVTNATHTGDVTGSTGLTIANDAVSYAKMQNISTTDRILGRNSSGAGDVEELTPGNLRTMLNVADGAEVNVQADWNSSSGDSQILNKPTIPSNIGDLSNVSSSTPSTNQVLKWNGSVWAPAADNTSSGSGTTDLSHTANGTSLTIESSSGNNTSLPAATTSAWGVMTDDDKTALDSAILDGDFTSNGFMKRTGAGTYTVDTNTYLTSIPSSYLQNLSEDTTPQLGGDLDMNSKFISSGILGIKNTGSQSELRLYCESNNAHYASIKAPAHADFSGNITYTLPSGYGSDGQVLKSDGSGGTSWVDQTTDTNTQLSNAEVRAAVEAASDSNVFTDADHTKLDGLVSNATHTGEVTGSTALTIADNVVDEANLKVSNTPTDGYVLTAQSGNTGGLTWAAASGGGGGLSSDSAYNTYGGTNAGDAFDGTNAVNNTVVGYNAGTEISTGLDNVIVGYNAGATSTSGQYNTALGSEALKSATYAWNNVAVGYQSLYNVVGSSKNTAIGTKAGYSLTGNQGNTYIGWLAGYAHTGSNTTIIGYDAGKAATSVDNLTLVGYEAGKAVTTGVINDFFGYQAGLACTTGNRNTGIGYRAMYLCTTGYRNVSIGAISGTALTTGYKNTFIGYYSGYNTTTGYNNIVIGHLTEASSATVNNEITLGDSNITSLRCADTSISSLSDRRDKTDIVDLPVGLDFVNSLKPRQFKWQTREGVPSKDGTVRAGFIAQELQEVQTGAEYLDLVMDENPDKLEAKQGKLIPVLVKAIQELSAQVTALKAG